MRCSLLDLFADLCLSHTDSDQISLSLHQITLHTHKLTHLSHLDQRPTLSPQPLQPQIPCPYFLQRIKRAVLNGDPAMIRLLNDMLQYFKMPIPFSQPNIVSFERKKPGCKLLVLDMDETLIFAGNNSYYFWEEIPYPHLGFTMGLNRRPFLQQFLEKANQLFELVLFTAGSRSYAERIADHIDPHRLISHRFYRDSCLSLTQEKGPYIKDLQIFNTPLKDVIIVDNTAYCYQRQIANAVPILPFSWDDKDSELLSLLKYLQLLANCDDVRRINQKQFQLNKYSHFEDGISLVKSLY